MLAVNSLFPTSSQPRISLSVEIPRMWWELRRIQRAGRTL
ncbi:unnamed protein product [Tenebrio molitor]|nr:unnamed protein product [Tenebrio molitor]